MQRENLKELSLSLSLSLILYQPINPCVCVYVQMLFQFIVSI